MKVPHVVVTSIVPPGTLYSVPPRSGPDVHMFVDFDTNSPYTSIQYIEEMLEFTNLPASERIGFVIDVKAIRTDSDNYVEVVDVGWTFFPIQQLLPNEDGSQSLYSNAGLLAVSSVPSFLFLVAPLERTCQQRTPFLRYSKSESLPTTEKRQKSSVTRAHKCYCSTP